MWLSRCGSLPNKAFSFLQARSSWIGGFHTLYNTLKVGWRGNFFGLSESVCLKTYQSRIKVHTEVKSWNSQMSFHSVETFPHDVNCRNRHRSGSTLLHMRACAMGSQSRTSTTLSHFWLLGSKYQAYQREMDPKTKTNTYEFTAFSLVLTLSLPRNQASDANSVTEWIYSPLSKTVFQS